MKRIDLTAGTAHDLTSGDYIKVLDPKELDGFTKMEVEIELDSMAAGNDGTICTVRKSHTSSFAGYARQLNQVDTASDLTYANATHGTGDGVVLRGTANDDNGYQYVEIRVTPTGAAAGDTVEVSVLLS